MSQNQKRFGLYFISLMTAYGLGNIWRFPYVVFEYGKGSFLLLFCFLCFFVGIPLIVTELLMGKSIKDSENESSSYLYKVIFNSKKLSLLSWIPSIVTVVVLSYYTIINAWILHYISKLLYAHFAKLGFPILTVFPDLMNRSILLILLCSVHVLVIYLFLNKAEKLKYKYWITAVIPALTFVMGVVAYSYFSLDDAQETAKSLLYPNFFMLNKYSLNYAIGQMLFTLSLGFGVLLGIGKNLNSEASTTTIATRLGLTDNIISILLLSAIFPMILSTEYKGLGSEILFYVIPSYFSENGLSLLTAFFFYLLVYFCALTAHLGLAESVSLNIFESTKFSKTRSYFISSFAVFIISVLFIGFSELTFILDLKKYGFNVSGFTISQIVRGVDDILINFILPLSVILGLQAALIHLDSKYVREELSINEGIKTWPYYIYWKFILRFGFPFLFLMSLFIRFGF